MTNMLFTSMPMFVCLFWSVMIAFELHSDGKNRPRLHLLVFMLTTTVLYFGHCVFFNHNTKLIPFTDTLYCVANLSVYPLYFSYICSLTTRKNKYQYHWILLLPAVLAGICIGTLYLSMEDEEAILFIDHYLYDGTRTGLTGMAQAQAFVHDVCKVIFALLIIPVFFLGRQHIQRYEELLLSVYSDIEEKTLKQLDNMLVAFIITSAASFTVNLIGRQCFDGASWLLMIPSVLFSTLLFVIGFIGHRQQFSMEDIEKDEQQADSISNDRPMVQELRARIEKLMEQEQLYRKPNIKIVDLVNKLNTNRNYIYQAINREMGMSFNEYVNRMRIEYAAMLMAQHPTKTLSEIAELSGFSSDTSFYRNFKLYRGFAPKEYQNSLKKKEV